MTQYLFSLGEDSEEPPEPTEIRPNIWFLSCEEIPPLLFTPEGAAKCLGVGRPQVYRLMQSGALRSVKVGGSRRVSARALREYVNALDEVG